MNATSQKVEIELKLILPGSEAEKAIVDFLRRNKYKLEKIQTLNNADTYLDSSDWSLMKNHFYLRYRLSNNQAIYTMKSVAPIKDGIAKRTETEEVLEEPAHAANVIPVKTLKKQVDDIISPRKLLEQVMIRTNRKRYVTISPEGAKFELAFDTSTFSANPLYKAGRVPLLYMLEAELLDGPESALQTMASKISSKFAYPPATISKLETAMTRLKVAPVVKVVPDNLKVRLDDRLEAALKKMLAVEFRWFQEQLPGTLSDRDPEFVHQARVSIRRMRSVLILFHSAINDKDAIYLEERMKWLGGLFGQVRDLDVFIINLAGYKDSLDSFPKSKRRALEALIVKQRRSPLKGLKTALLSRRYKNFQRSMIKLLGSTDSGVAARTTAMKPIHEFAPEALTQKYENVIEQSKKTLKEQNFAEFHCLRIQMKRLRYTLEFIAPAYGDVFSEFIRHTVSIQDCLGELHDTVFNQKLIRRILKDWRGKLCDPDLIFILGEIYQLQRETAQERTQTFNKIWPGFASEHTRASLKEIFKVQPGGSVKQTT